MSTGLWRRVSAGLSPALGRSRSVEAVDGLRLRPLDGESGLVVQADATMIVESDAQDPVRIGWSVRTGSQWHRIGALEPRQTRRGNATVVTTVGVDQGHIRLAVGAGVSAGSPVGVVEVTNETPTPVAIGVDAVTPAPVEVKEHTAWAGSRPLITSVLRPGRSPDAQSAGEPSLIVALPHSATARFTLPLDRAHAPHLGPGGGAVPTLEDIERGWRAHLSRGMQVTIDGEQGWTDPIPALIHNIVTAPPDECSLDEVTAAALFGFSLPAGHVLTAVEDRAADPATVLSAVGTWNRLDDAATQADADIAEGLLVAVAKAAHTQKRSGPGSMALGAGSRPILHLAGALRSLGQPDVADQVQGLAGVFDDAMVTASLPTLAELTDWLAPRSDLELAFAHRSAGARYLIGLRHLVVDSRRAGAVSLLSDLAPRWRGRAIDVLNAPIGTATVSYGLRWHGPRPALLWSVEAEGDETLPQLDLRAIDPNWTTNEPNGEALLADPGWTAS